MKKKLGFIALALLGLAILGVLGFEIWQVKRLKSQIADLAWGNTARSRSEYEDSIEPTVGVIQFLKRGYSIQLKKVNYTADGLKLEGFVGNPLGLTLSNLTLDFSVTKPIYAYRNEFFKEHTSKWLWFGPAPIGRAQTSPIASLSFGSTAPFDVTIPNVKQTPEGIRIVVKFTGERYSLYLQEE
jgi:hypothetical protein